MSLNWKELTELHVISKIKDVVKDWFDSELFFVDLNGQVHSKNWQNDYKFSNQLLTVQSQLTHGLNILSHDFESFFDSNQDKTPSIVDSAFVDIKYYASPVSIDGELVGCVFAYPLLPKELSDSERKALKQRLMDNGASDNDATICLNSLKSIDGQNLNYFGELINLISEEISTYHQEIQKREDRIKDLNSELGDKYRYHSMIGKSKSMQRIYRLLEKVSSSESSVFVLGENGTGKELVAKAIHYYSPRKDKIFLAVNCSAFNDNLLDSELFGHVKGAFTGAMKDKKGLFEQADGGTLFLDEIGDTSLSMQVKLLRVLQEGTFLPVGATSPKRCDVRIVAATNKNIKKMMSDGEFREDLFYRINVINVDLPPLRERGEDVPILIDHFLDKKCSEEGHALKTLSKKTLEKMLDYPWPGNVRELENEVERLFVLSGHDKTVTPDLLSPRILEHAASGGGAGVAGGIIRSGNLKEAQEELERVMIKEGLRRCNFNKSKLAKELGISRASLITKVDKYELDKRKKAAS